MAIPGSALEPGPAGTIIATGYAPVITVSADGFIYVVSLGGNEIQMLVSTDGGDTFQPSMTPPATGITTIQDVLPATDAGFPVFPDGTFRVLTDPTACSAGPMVLVAWADYREGISRIYYARSNDAGATLDHWPVGTAAPDPIDTLELSALSSADRDRSQRRGRVHVL